MDILIRYVNIYNGSLVVTSIVVLFVTALIYRIQKRRHRHNSRLKLKLIESYNKSIKFNDSSIFVNTVSEALPSGSMTMIASFFAKKKCHELHNFIPLFAKETFQKKLRQLLKKGNAQQRIEAANMLSYYPCEKTLKALRKACSDHRQEVAVAAALSLLNSDPEVSLAQLIIQLFNSTTQKGLFCFLRLVPSNTLLHLESQLIIEESISPDNALLAMLIEISNNFIIPYVTFAREDQRDYMQSLFEILLGLQYKASGVIHSCYILNFINEFCYQEKICSIQKLITEYFNFESKLFVCFLDEHENTSKNQTIGQYYE
ncbi:HEAT repeat domain-containing protein [Gilliamella sp. wkB112]|uniref:HEAT repeat domain-containing protein n=1 Tax=Gilliamella sp. wkB112 TaxID=3120257 RepID=UPI00080E7921|nr:HEAT repeat domain-containing protein [Gilliamella apicola]OCG01089.1 hypothetical protein A9G12_00575 [Gilliamella apicola]